MKTNLKVKYKLSLGANSPRRKAMATLERERDSKSERRRVQAPSEPLEREQPRVAFRLAVVNIVQLTSNFPDAVAACRRATRQPEPRGGTS